MSYIIVKQSIPLSQLPQCYSSILDYPTVGIYVHPIDDLKGHKHIAQGNTLGFRSTSYRPEGATAMLFLLMPLQGDCHAFPFPKAVPWADGSLSRWDVSALKSKIEKTYFELSHCNTVAR